MRSDNTWPKVSIHLLPQRVQPSCCPRGKWEHIPVNLECGISIGSNSPLEQRCSGWHASNMATKPQEYYQNGCSRCSPTHTLRGMAHPGRTRAGWVAQPRFACSACIAAYSDVLPILSRAAASLTFSPLLRSSRARCSLSAVTTGLRPPFRPRAAAAVNPALVRSRIRSRSNWPSAPNT